jgi:hypothetical protein
LHFRRFGWILGWKLKNQQQTKSILHPSDKKAACLLENFEIRNMKAGGGNIFLLSCASESKIGSGFMSTIKRIIALKGVSIQNFVKHILVFLVKVSMLSELGAQAKGFRGKTIASSDLNKGPGSSSRNLILPNGSLETSGTQLQREIVGTLECESRPSKRAFTVLDQKTSV